MKNIKELVLVGVVVAGAVLFINKMDSIGKEQYKAQVEEYKECILNQSEEQGWIIRSSCSMNYAQLDKDAGLEYTQVGYDLYVK